jgi:hypothetical protein
MTAHVEIPADFLARAQEHLRRTGQPFVYCQQRRDRELIARQNPVSGRWMLYAVPEPMPVGRFAFAELLMKFTECAGTAIDGLPRRFHCEGHEIGRVDYCDGLAVVSSGLALTCLSYVLRHHETRTGFFVRVVDAHFRSPSGR